MADTNTGVLVAHPQFHRVKAAALEFEIRCDAIGRQLQAEMQAAMRAEFLVRIQPAKEQRAREFAAAGLDPSKNYELNEQLQTVTEFQPGRTG